MLVHIGVCGFNELLEGRIACSKVFVEIGTEKQVTIANIQQASEQRYALLGQITKADSPAASHTGQKGRSPARRDVLNCPVKHSSLFKPPADIMASVSSGDQSMAAQREIDMPPILHEVLNDLDPRSARTNNQHTSNREVGRARVPIR